MLGLGRDSSYASIERLLSFLETINVFAIGKMKQVSFRTGKGREGIEHTFYWGIDLLGSPRERQCGRLGQRFRRLSWAPTEEATEVVAGVLAGTLRTGVRDRSSGLEEQG